MPRTWYFTRDNRTKIGPFSAQELHQLGVTGLLAPTDMVIKEGERKWVVASSIPDLFAESVPNHAKGGGPKMRALSIRQPFAELIMMGKKDIEYRSRPTHLRGRVYIYACKSPSDPKVYEARGLDPEELPHGLLVGTVEIVDCVEGDGKYEWRLGKPRRLQEPLEISAMPQPGFFWPFGK